MADLKAMLKTVTDKFAKTQVVRPEALKRMEKVIEAARKESKTPPAEKGSPSRRG